MPAPVLRASTSADQEFLAALFASTRAEELAMTGWPEEFKAAFCAQQFAAQTAHYRQHYAHAAFSVIEHEDAPVGRLIVLRQADRIHVVDISLLPAVRGRGMGSRLIRALFREGKTVGLCVAKDNQRARRLYDRLGFRQVADEGGFWRMEWCPAQSVTISSSSPGHTAGVLPFDQTDATLRVP